VSARKRSSSPHARFERLLARAMTSPDPIAALRAASRDRALPAAVRRRLAAADEDGVRLSALLVARLRFERLMRGSREAEDWYESDAAAFTEAFRRYHSEVPPTAFFPRGEAELFAAWRQRASRRTA